jgi:hypothetical protein
VKKSTIFFQLSSQENQHSFPITSISNGETLHSRCMRIWFVVFLISYFLSNGVSAKPPVLTVYPKLSHYYYQSFQEKFQESTSIIFCKSTNFEKIHFDLLIPSESVRILWNQIQNLVTYHGVSQTLCQSPQFHEYIEKFLGCFHPPPRQKGLASIRAVTHFHTDHPRCHNSKISSSCSSQGNTFFPMKSSNIAFQQYPFLINTTLPVMTSRSGMLVMRCGILGLYNSCKAHSFGVYAAMLDGPERKEKNATLCYPSNLKPLRCPFPSVNILFIVSQYDDTQIGQFFLEALPRVQFSHHFILAPHFLFL